MSSAVPGGRQCGPRASGVGDEAFPACGLETLSFSFPPSLQLKPFAHRCALYVRSGCFCNPGLPKIAFGFAEEDLAECFKDKQRMTYDQFRQVIEGRKQGALRISVSLVTNFADVYRFLQFAQAFVDKRA